MIRLRVLAGAFLTNGTDMLMMKRSEKKKFYPGLWAGIGGHVEPQEINDPHAACLREIREETGLTEVDVTDLALRYIVLRRCQDEIRLNYAYFGESAKRKLADCDEGELHWLHRDMVQNLPMSALNRLIIRRYLEKGIENDVMVGTLNGSDAIEWMKLSAWEGL